MSGDFKLIADGLNKVANEVKKILFARDDFKEIISVRLDTYKDIYNPSNKCIVKVFSNKEGKATLFKLEIPCVVKTYFLDNYDDIRLKTFTREMFELNRKVNNLFINEHIYSLETKCYDINKFNVADLVSDLISAYKTIYQKNKP